jgi:hypothetical protein
VSWEKAKSKDLTQRPQRKSAEDAEKRKMLGTERNI